MGKNMVMTTLIQAHEKSDCQQYTSTKHHKTRKHLKSCHLINRRSWVGYNKNPKKNTPISLATRAFTNCRVFLPPGELWGFLSANETIARWHWKGKGKEVRPKQRDRIGTFFCSERKDLLINGTSWWVFFACLKEDAAIFLALWPYWVFAFYGALVGWWCNGRRDLPWKNAE